MAAKVAYQGVPGAYSEVAARKACPDFDPLPCDQFEVAFQVGSWHGLVDCLPGACAPSTYRTRVCSGSARAAQQHHIGVRLFLAAQALSQWMSERAVLPIENSLGGSIHAV